MDPRLLLAFCGAIAILCLGIQFRTRRVDREQRDRHFRRIEGYLKLTVLESQGEAESRPPLPAEKTVRPDKP